MDLGNFDFASSDHYRNQNSHFEYIHKSLKSDDSWVRHSCKMAPIRYLEFSKFDILVKRPVTGCDSVSASKFRVNWITRRRDFKNGIRPSPMICKILIFGNVTILKIKIRIS